MWAVCLLCVRWRKVRVWCVGCEWAVRGQCVRVGCVDGGRGDREAWCGARGLAAIAVAIAAAATHVLGVAPVAAAAVVVVLVAAVVIVVVFVVVVVVVVVVVPVAAAAALLCTPDTARACVLLRQLRGTQRGHNAATSAFKHVLLLLLGHSRPTSPTTTTTTTTTTATAVTSRVAAAGSAWV